MVQLHSLKFWQSEENEKSQSRQIAAMVAFDDPYAGLCGQAHRESRIGSFKEVSVFHFLKGQGYLALGLEIRAQNVGRWWMVVAVVVVVHTSVACVLSSLRRPRKLNFST